MNKHEEAFELAEEVCRHLLGAGETRGLELLKALPELNIRARGNHLLVSGDSAGIEVIRKFIKTLELRIQAEGDLSSGDMRRLLNECLEKPSSPNGQTTRKCEANQSNGALVTYQELLLTHSGKTIRAKTPMQQAYLDAIRTHDVTIAIGPAGTGKTYLACAMAVRALREKQVNRLILSRPTIEAGEKLGYLPGDLMEKVDPHFRPLYDALQEFLGIARFQQMLRQGIIEITPLAYMRGRTFNEAFIVLDEAQNTTERQMRMFLTRMGYGSRVVVTGDRTQIDLPYTKESSLHTLRKVLGKIERLAFIELGERDVIRHELVRRIIQAYEEYEAAKGEVG